MKHLKLVSALFLSILFFNVSQAQQNESLAQTVLWKIEHPELKVPSYVFGTLHMMCPSDFAIPEKVTNTLQNVDALVLEVNLSDPEEMQSLQAAMSESKKISEELSQEQFNQLDALVTQVTAVPLSAYDAYGLSVLNSILLTKMLPCETFKSLENEITQIAINNKTPIYSLEKAAEQMDMLQHAYPATYAFEQMMLFEDYKKDFNAGIALYKQEDITNVSAKINQPKYMDENAIKFMLIERNKNWVEKMPEMMKERSNLFAVGAAHLTEEYGVLNLLQKQGYTVTPVYK